MTTMTVIRVAGHLAGPWAIGSAGHDADDNIPVLRDPHTKQPVLPATSLVGALRVHLSDPVGWLGPLPADRPGGDQEPTPSRLWTLGTVLDAPRMVITRHRTAINGWRGAAAGATLRSEQAVDATRTGFRWALCHDGPVDTDLLDEIAGWRCEIGARRTTGLGRLVIDQVTAVAVNLKDPAGLTWWLTDRDAWLQAAEDTAAAAPPSAPTVRSVPTDEQPADVETWNWQLVDPMHVGTGEVADDGATMGRSTRTREFRRAPRDGSDTGELLEIPGSAWKGVFRHRVSTVLRICGAADGQIDDVVHVLFGHHGDDNGADARSARRRGLLRFQVSTVTVKQTLTRTHVAIDRISGGAAESKLFSVRSVPTGTARLELGGIAGLPAAVRDLLSHVVLDLHEGLIGLGAFTTRGYGTICLTDPPPTVGAVDVPAVTGWAAGVIAAVGATTPPSDEEQAR